jgi:16S rRNA (adenine1518-N6/adenine1519-N6)-dimethyltransferase
MKKTYTKYQAKKKFGQNFLKDTSVLDRIIQSMPHNDNQIVEIGPGLGDLTRRLVKCKSVTAYEVDRDLYSILQTEFCDQLEAGSLNIILGDVLNYWQDNRSLYDGRYDLIANLPYYIATNIILQCLNDNNCEHIIVMIQKEVADKFTAKCGQKEFGALSVIATSMCSDLKTLCVVPPQSFDPPPKVDSSVILLKKDLTKSIDEDFNMFLKIAFSAPRKRLLKNLTHSYDKKLLEEIFEHLGIDSNARPHQVEASLYSHIYTKVNNNGNSRRESRSTTTTINT